MEIYFVRHGETVWNTEKRFQGLSDSPLTKTGIMQAKLLGKKLENIKFDKFYSSSLKRAKDTAELIKGKREMKVEIFDDFIEISMGAMEGIQHDDFKAKYPEQQNAFYYDPINYDPKPYDGESFLEVRERVIKGLEKLVKINLASERILVVSHGATLKTLFHYLSGRELDDFKDVKVPKNTSYTIVKYENKKFEIIDFSNTSHLDNL